PDQFGCSRTTSRRRAIGPSMPSMTSATPSQANMLVQCSRTASSMAISAMPAPSAVRTCTVNAAARIRDEDCDRSGGPARLTGVGGGRGPWVGQCYQDSPVFAHCGFRPRNFREPFESIRALKLTLQVSIVPFMNDASMTFDTVVVGGGPAGLTAAIALADAGARTALLARRAPYA